MTVAEFRKLTPEKQAEFAKADPVGFQRAYFNLEGEARGIAVCLECGDSRMGKPFHEVEYESGPMQIGTFKFRGTKSAAWMCEECWQKATPEERLVHHDAIHKAKVKAIPRIVPRSTPDGKLPPCPVDTIRFEKEKAEIDSLHIAVREIVKAGGG